MATLYAYANVESTAIYEWIRPTEFRDYWWRLQQDPVSLPSEPQPYRPVYERG